MIEQVTNIKYMLASVNAKRSRNTPGIVELKRQEREKPRGSLHPRAP